MNNKYTKEYINYYLSLTTEPQYAIMLKGAGDQVKLGSLSVFLMNISRYIRNSNS